MNGYDLHKACQYISARIPPALKTEFSHRLTEIVDAFLLLDLQFMHQTQVLDADGNQGEGDYDEDDAFEYILDAYLAHHPTKQEHEMALASLLDDTMRLQDQYLQETGLAEG